MLKFTGPHKNIYVFSGLRSIYYLQLDPKLGNDQYKIKQIFCVFVVCTTMLDKPQKPFVPNIPQSLYHSIKEWFYWTMLDTKKKEYHNL